MSTFSEAHVDTGWHTLASAQPPAYRILTNLVENTTPTPAAWCSSLAAAYFGADT